jgi:hypothetical protein
LLKSGKGWLIPENLAEVNPCKCRKTVRFNYNITRICVGCIGKWCQKGPGPAQNPLLTH